MFFCEKIMLKNIKTLSLYQFFMVLDFKVNGDRVVGTTAFSFSIQFVILPPFYEVIE